MVSADLMGGWQLVDALVGRGFKVEVAFWAKLSGDEEKWVLYIVSPGVDPLAENSGLREAYQLIHALLRDAPEWGIDPFVVLVLGVDHPMAKAAADLVKPKVPAGPFAVPNSKPYRGVTRSGGRSLGGMPVEGAFIYPPWEPGLNPVG